VHVAGRQPLQYVASSGLDPTKSTSSVGPLLAAQDGVRRRFLQFGAILLLLMHGAARSCVGGWARRYGWCGIARRREDAQVIVNRWRRATQVEFVSTEQAVIWTFEVKSGQLECSVWRRVLT